MLTLKKWLEERELQQKEAAALLGCAQSTLSRILNHQQDPTPQFIRAAHRISEGAIEPNNLFPDLFAESATA